MRGVGILYIISLLFLACSEKSEYLEDDDLIIFRDNMPTGSTKTSLNGNVTTFVSGDSIGVFQTLSNRNNVRYNYNGSVWSAPSTPLYWYNTNSNDTFYAYFPYNASSQNKIAAIPILNNQSFGATVPDMTCDLLVAGPKIQAKKEGTNVPLSFSHAFSMLQFTVTAPLISTYNLQRMIIQAGNTVSITTYPYGIVNIVNSVVSVGYDLQGQKLYFTSGTNNSATFSQTISKPISSTGVIGTVPINVYAFVLPGQYSNPTPGIQFQVYALLTGTKTTNLVKLANTTFEAGKKYIYNVQIGGLIGVRSTRELEPEIQITSSSVENL